MDHQLDALFAELQRNAEKLTVRGDNEAARHDLLVRPILTSPLALGWEPSEALPQFETSVSREIVDSYYWRDATPRKRRPDLVLIPYRIGTVVGVVEEKSQQASIVELEAHVGQLLEYQYLHRCVWGLLTDGEKWVLTRNHEVLHRFDGLGDLRKHLKDLQACLGREAMLERFRRHGVWDIVYIRPAPSLIVVGSSSSATTPRTLGDFLRFPSKEGRDLVLHLYRSTRNAALEKLDLLPKSHTRTLAHVLFGSAFHDHLGGVIMLADVALRLPGNSKVMTIYPSAVERCVTGYPIFQAYCAELCSGVTASAGWVARLANEANYLRCLSTAPAAFIEEALNDPRVAADNSLRPELERYLAAARDTA